MGSVLAVGLLCIAAAEMNAQTNSPNRAILTTGEASHQAVIYADPANAPMNQTTTAGLPADAVPHGLAVFGDDGALLADYGNSRIFVVQVSTAAVTSTIDTSAASYDGEGTVAVSPQGDYALAIDGSNNLIAIQAPFDSSSAITTVTMPGLGSNPGTQSIVFNSAGRAFVRTSAGVSVLDAPYNSIAFTIPLDLDPVSPIGSITITPDGKTLLVTNQNQGFGSTIYIFNAPYSASSTSQTLLTNSGLRTLQVSPDGTKAIYVIGDFFGSRAVRTLNAPFNSSSIGETLPLPPGVTSFEDVGFSTDGSLAILGGGSSTEAPLLIKAPFTAAGAELSYIPVDAANPARGSGAARFLPGGAPVAASSLLNISTRLQVLTGNQVLIGGFIVTGTDPKMVILRAIGPALADFGISDALADPVLELRASDGSLIMSNDNWRMDQESEIEMTGLAPSKDLESAIVATLDPGAYTAIVSGKNGGTGVGLVEAYDLDSASDSELANISTRGFVATESNVMIGGFILGSEANVLIRAIGPSLADFGVAGALADPTLELRDVQGTLISSNDNWKDPNQLEIEMTGLQPSKDAESTVLETLPAGAYTAIVAGAGATTGVGLVEVYRLP